MKRPFVVLLAGGVVFALVGCSPQSKFTPDRFEINQHNFAIKGWMTDSQLCVEARLKPHDAASLHDMTLVNAAGGRLPPYKWEDRTPFNDEETYVGHGLDVGWMTIRWPGSRYDYYNQYWSSTPPTEIDACWRPVSEIDVVEDGSFIVTLLSIDRQRIEITTARLKMELFPPIKKKDTVRQVKFHMEEMPVTRVVPLLEY